MAKEVYIRGAWWKLTGVVLLLFVLVQGLYGEVPQLPILEESIRNLFFHVPMWFAMMFLMLVSVIYSIMHLARGDRSGSPGAPRDARSIAASVLHRQRYDILASQFARVGFLLGFLGLVTGAVWARSTWGAWWVFEEIKLNAAAAGMLVYAAYFILRGSVDDPDRRARIAAVYNIFAFVMYIVLINVIPRIVESSLHPGNGGNPGFNTYDLDHSLRLVFYPAVIGWGLLAGWIVDLSVRLKRIEIRKNLIG